MNPEQTTSLLSLILYSFLDPIIFLAYRVPRLSHDMLPPLADYDYTKNLVKRSFKASSPWITGAHVLLTRSASIWTLILEVPGGTSSGDLWPSSVSSSLCC